MNDLIPRSPLRDLETLHGEIDRIFNSFFTPVRNGRLAAATVWAPAMDVLETDEEFVVKMDLPGLSREDVEVEVRDGVLTIAGERKREERSEEDGYVRVERSAGRFRRQISVPAGTDPQRIRGEFADGVLELRVPKPDQARTHRIAIGEGKAHSEEEK